MNDDLDARPSAMDRAWRVRRRRASRAPRVVSGVLLVLATVMGVRLGLAGPTVSPVSSAAIAALYGPPPSEASTAQSVVGQVMTQEHQRSRQDGRAHD